MMHPMTDQLQPLLRGFLRGSDGAGAAEGEGSAAAGTSGHDGIEDTSQRRRLEDANVDYWRQRAGWADDDETMKDYNQGVYETYYMGDDAAGDYGGGSSSSKSSGSAARAGLDHLGWILGLASTLVFLVMLVKCCSSAPASGGRKGRTSSVKSRDSSRSIRDKHGERRSRSRSRAASGRSRSKSRTRSKSKSRRGVDNDGGDDGGGGGADYKLMDDDDAKSRRSTKSSSSKRSSRSRSRSKSARSRSRSKARSKSRSRQSNGEGRKDREDSKGEKKKESSKEQKMLV